LEVRWPRVEIPRSEQKCQVVRGMGEETAYSKKTRRMGGAKERSKAAQLGCPALLITAGILKVWCWVVQGNSRSFNQVPKGHQRLSHSAQSQTQRALKFNCQKGLSSRTIKHSILISIRGYLFRTYCQNPQVTPLAPHAQLRSQGSSPTLSFQIIPSPNTCTRFE
jgi:hypothetical protein